MNLFLITAVGNPPVTGDRDSALQPALSSESGLKSDSLAGFPRLLSGRLAELDKDTPEVQQTADRDVYSAGRGNQENGVDNSVTGQDQAPGTHQRLPTGESGAPRVEEDSLLWPVEDASWPGKMESWGLMAGLMASVETSGTGVGNLSDFTLPAGFAAGIGTRLAGEIAGRYLDRNGIQTITLKLDSNRLGQIDVRLQARGDRLIVNLETAQHDSEAALRENSRELTEAILKRNDRFQQVEVRVDLKERTETDRKSVDDDGNQRQDPHNKESSREDRGTGGQSARREFDGNETEPDQRAQGG